MLTEHYDPAPSEIVQRYKFHMKIRQLRETITTFVAELRAIAQYCTFGDRFTSRSVRVWSEQKQHTVKVVIRENTHLQQSSGDCSELQRKM